MVSGCREEVDLDFRQRPEFARVTLERVEACGRLFALVAEIRVDKPYFVRADADHLVRLKPVRRARTIEPRCFTVAAQIDAKDAAQDRL